MRKELSLPNAIVLVSAILFTSSLLSIIYYSNGGVRSVDVNGVGQSMLMILLTVFAAAYYNEPIKGITLLLFGSFVGHIAYGVRIDMFQSPLFFEYIIMDFLTLFEGICLIGLFLKIRHNVTRLLMIHLGFMAVFIIQCVTYPLLQIVHVSGKLYFFENLDIFIAEASLAYLLYRKDVRDISVWDRFESHLHRTEDGLVVDPDSYIPPENLDILLGKNTEAWVEKDGNPIESEAVTYIQSKHRKWKVIARKWAGEEYTRCRIAPEEGSKGSIGLSIEIAHVEYLSIDGRGMIRIYGCEGRFIDLWTERPPRSEEGLRMKLSNKLDDMEE